MHAVEFIGVRMEMPSNTPVVLLKEAEGSRVIPIWIGAVEATAIAYAQQGVVPPRPLTHDLMKDILVAVGAELNEVQISDLTDGVFYATLVFANGVTVSARPSDAIALALRLGAPIAAADAVMEAAGVEMPEEEEEPQDEVEQFRAFLDQISPEDFQE